MRNLDAGITRLIVCWMGMWYWASPLGLYLEGAAAKEYFLVWGWGRVDLALSDPVPPPGTCCSRRRRLRGIRRFFCVWALLP